MDSNRATMRRRGLIALALCGATGSVAAASWLRKPVLPPLATPLVAPMPADLALRGLEAMVPTTPPKPLPAFSFQDAAGAAHTLGDFTGHVVVLNLWATWCQPCIAELPALAALARRGPTDGIAVLALATDRGGAATVRRFLDAHAIDLPIWVDPPGLSGEALGARGLPTTVLIDRTGLERGRVEGAVDWSSDATRRAILEATRT